MMSRRIRISVEVNYAGIDIPDEYVDLPEGWDEMSKKEQGAYLSDRAVEAAAEVVGSGACVVDENGEVVE